MKNVEQSIDFRRYPIPRVRHHAGPQLYLPLEQQHIRPDWYPPLIDHAPWHEWFGNGAFADVLDIGCGRGGFMLEHALALPELNILGLEVRMALVDWIDTVIQGEGLKNVKAAWYSAVNGLGFIPTASVQYVTYLFADPWPKRRHFKRRLFSESLLTEIDRILMPNGRIYFATDVPEVEEHQRHTIVEHGVFTIHPITDSDPWPFPFMTDQEQFCIRKNIPYTLYYATR